VPNILYWHPSSVHSRYPVKRLEEFYNNLDRSQENVEKLRVCEAVACAEFYTNQILVNSDEDLVYRIDLIDEQDYAKL
jgi:NADH:ubiquinone oxidoreductase subunit E